MKSGNDTVALLITQSVLDFFRGESSAVINLLDEAKIQRDFNANLAFFVWKDVDWDQHHASSILMCKLAALHKENRGSEFLFLRTNFFQGMLQQRGLFKINPFELRMVINDDMTASINWNDRIEAARERAINWIRSEINDREVTSALESVIIDSITSNSQKPLTMDRRALRQQLSEAIMPVAERLALMLIQ